MEFEVRTRRVGVPEPEQRDAVVEFVPTIGAYVVGRPGVEGAHFIAIFYCPWCGTKLPEIDLTGSR